MIYKTDPVWGSLPLAVDPWEGHPMFRKTFVILPPYEPRRAWRSLIPRVYGAAPCAENDALVE